MTMASVRAQTLMLFAGGGTEVSGSATNCHVYNPFGIDFDLAGNTYIAEMAGGERVLKINSVGQLSVLAGTGEKGDSGDGGPAGEARFNGMHSLAVGPDGDIFLADTWNNRIRRIDAKSGHVFAFAGTRKRGFSGDGGQARDAEFGNVYCVAFDSAQENLFVADLDNRRIRAINLKSGIVTTVAGNGQRGVPFNGAKATESPLVDPRAVAVDSKGGLYILERSGHALRKVERDGTIRTVAGAGKKGNADGDALKAEFNEPKHLCIDANDDVIIADTDNHVIRKFLPKENKVLRIAGADSGPFKLNQPHGVKVDKSGVLYIVDSLNNRVLKVVGERHYAVLRCGPLEAVIVDNAAIDDAVLPGHRAGYHGLASLKHTRQQRNIFVPAYAGLNFEHIHDGTTQPHEILFEPRFAPMELHAIDDHTAELHQPPTPHWGMESWMRYELLDNGVIEMKFACVPRRVSWRNNYLGLFWANYIDQPESLDIHFLAAPENNWIRGVTPSHGVLATHLSKNDHREFPHDADFPLSLVFNFSKYRYAEPWYFGACRGMAFVQLFRGEDQIRLSQSPSGGGSGNPAWDFQHFISEPKVGQRYDLAMRALYIALPEGKSVEESRQEIAKRTRSAAFAE